MSNGKPWLPHHTRTLRLLLAVGYRYQQIAMITGHSWRTIKKRAEDLNLDPPPRIDCNWMRKKRA